MRRLRWIAIIVLLIAMAGFETSPARAADVSLDFFYSNLSPHGSWLVSGQYGRVWRPSVYAASWNPYYDGHWVYTDFGWTWVSDYPWGGVCYHYGTWVDDPVLGWAWVPGYVWAPAWVVFRTGPDYIGWAPVEPGFSVGASFTFGAPHAGPFLFVPTSSFLAPRIRGCVVPRSRTTVIINNTKVVNNLVVENNVIVNRGPDVRTIEHASGRTIREVPIERAGRVTPDGRVRREQLVIDPQRQRMLRGVRAAEPVSTQTTPNRPYRAQIAAPPSSSARIGTRRSNEERVRNPRPPALRSNTPMTEGAPQRTTRNAVQPSRSQASRQGSAPLSQEGRKQARGGPHGAENRQSLSNAPRQRVVQSTQSVKKQQRGKPQRPAQSRPDGN